MTKEAESIVNPILASLLNLAGPDTLIILLIVLLLFGAKRLPDLARGMGRAVQEFSAARDKVEKELTASSCTGQARAQLEHSKSSDQRR